MTIFFYSVSQSAYTHDTPILAPDKLNFKLKKLNLKPYLSGFNKATKFVSPFFCSLNEADKHRQPCYNKWSQ